MILVRSGLLDMEALVLVRRNRLRLVREMMDA